MGDDVHYSSSETSSLLRDDDNVDNNATYNTSAETSQRTAASGERAATFWKNLLVLSVTFLLTFTAFSSIQNLESSLNHAAGLGVASLACIYGGVVLSCVVAPAYVARVGPKWSVVTGLGAQVLFTAANFLPAFGTLIPASVLLGLASGPLWTGQGAYVTQLAHDYADTVAGDDRAVYLACFNGVFFGFFMTSQIIGNLISSLVLFEGVSDNSTVANSSVCGADFCDLDALNGSSAHGGSIAPSQQLQYLLLGVYAACALAGLLLFSVLADNRKPPATAQSPRQHAAATVNMHRDVVVLLLVPLFLWTGMEQSFMFAEYTQAFVSCHLGVGQVGYAMLAFGAVDAAASVTVGSLQKVTGRAFLILAAFAVNIAMLVLMLFWDPVSGNQRLLYVVPALWGVADAIWNATVCALIGTVFPDQQEPAFATFRLWQSLGFCIIFSISHFLCMWAKIYITVATCSVAGLLYVAMETVLWKRRTPPYYDLTEPIST